MNPILQKDFKLPYNPWGFFLFFIPIHYTLTYYSRPLSLHLLILLGGIALPFFLFLRSAPPPGPGEKPGFLLESLSPVFLRAWIWIPVLCLAVLPRFWKLGSPDWWLGGDDSLMAWPAVDLSNHWRWIPFVTLGQDPSTLSYLCYFTWKTFGSALLSFQLPPAVISVLTLFLAYPTARQFFSKSFSWILAGIIAFNYWAVIIARPLLPGVLMPLWELAVLYILGRWLKAKGGFPQRAWACLLGFGLGLGPYTFFAWPVLFLWVGGTACAVWWKTPPRDWKSFFCFFIFFGLAMGPFLAAIGQESYGGYLQDASAWSSFDGMNQLRIIAVYFSRLFWVGSPGAGWIQSGGYLNVLLSSCFFVGAAELFRFRKEPACGLLASALILSMLPGLLSHDIEPHRILLTLPILLAVSAAGLQRLLLYSPPGKRAALLAGLLVLSGGMDFPRLFPPHSDSASNGDEQKLCFDVVNDMALRQGPGLVFSDMTPNPMDLSLSYCSYPFNAAWNPKIPQGGVRWAAVFTERQYAAPLSRRFPQSHWLELPTGTRGVPSRHSLGLFPADPQTFPALVDWGKYSYWDQQINTRIINNPSRKSRREILSAIIRFYPDVPDDIFLQSCFFEKLLFNYSWEKTFHPEDAWANWKNFSPFLKPSFGKSYRDANLCEKYGRLLAMEGEVPEARKAFQRALKFYPGNEWLQSQLRQLDPPQRQP